MKLGLTTLGFGVALLTANVVPSFAEETRIGDILVNGAWSRATPNGAKVGVGYLRLTNTGPQSDRLVSLSSSAAVKTEVHEMTMKDGVMNMRPLLNGIDLDPGETVQFKPGATHIMFLDLSHPLKQGQKITAELVFEHAGRGMVTFEVESIEAQ